MAACRIGRGIDCGPSLRPSGCRAPGRDRRARSPGRALPFSSRTKRIDAVPAGAKRQGFCRWRRCGGDGSHGGGAGRPSWLRYCNVTFSPGSISQWAACTAAEHRISRWVDRMAAGLTEPRCVSERGLAMAGWRPAERRFAVGGSGKSVARCRARCSRTGSSNPSPSSEESCELSVPEQGVARPPIVAPSSLSGGCARSKRSGRSDASPNRIECVARTEAAGDRLRG
jgi:hypothetical protein